MLSKLLQVSKPYGSRLRSGICGFLFLMGINQKKYFALLIHVNLYFFDNHVCFRNKLPVWFGINSEFGFLSHFPAF